ncbi:hypothetical protein M409DRAFT_64781 [Zasmidium cellare ATCC 36951]|uniref:Galactose oxidase n=1 Tax=Zasmidium cellare ATCC 36951 TaxID=1080233 RepID=A0A6A6CUA2_ZASCE|nr:uncharacterized protein M409DRAFT_64781 [Zasmidium cellare ATCC 36951]KAF2169768.1 hypothetical protein M409DRAFT_64781 [Zasmidium cellare ATCC 36951]
MAAEAAAGVWAAEEVVSTGVQAGVGAYMVAKPTMPLKATFNQIATAKDDETRLSLARANHTLTVVQGKAYVFGGETASDKLASNEIHAVTLEHSDEIPRFDYSVLPALADDIDEGSGRVPAARSKHAACQLNVCVAVFGGVDESGKLVDRDPIVWLFVTAKSSWQALEDVSGGIAPSQRSNAKLFEANNNLVLFGGIDENGQELKDVWHFHYATRVWTPLPSAPVATSNAAVSGNTLYLISSSDNMSSDAHELNFSNFESAEWKSTSFPTNPLTPGPRPRVGGGLLPVSTGFGRNYLLYFFGARQNPHTSETTSPQDTEDPTQWADMWSYQVESSQPEVKATTNITEALKPSKIKDAIRSKLGYDTGNHSWAEVEVLPPGDLTTGEGKVHPGPRAYFGSDMASDGKSVVVWGGLNAKGEREGDGWLITLS